MPTTDPHADSPAFPDLAAKAGIESLDTEQTLWTAEFAPVTALALALQWFMGLALCLLMFAIIPIILVPCFGIGASVAILAAGWFATLALAKMYVASLRCLLTTRSVRAAGGVFFKWERSIPLDKITDVTMKQGPIARMYGVEHLGVETAGGGGGPGGAGGATIPLYGVVNPREFRRAVLEQRDRVVGTADAAVQRPSPPPGAGATSASGPDAQSVRDVLIEIRDELRAMRADQSHRKGQSPPERHSV